MFLEEPKETKQSNKAVFQTSQGHSSLLLLYKSIDDHGFFFDPATLIDFPCGLSCLDVALCFILAFSSFDAVVGGTSCVVGKLDWMKLESSNGSCLAFLCCLVRTTTSKRSVMTQIHYALNSHVWLYSTQYSHC